METIAHHGTLVDGVQAHDGHVEEDLGGVACKNTKFTSFSSTLTNSFDYI